jgi:hypothetical protein
MQDSPAKTVSSLEYPAVSPSGKFQLHIRHWENARIPFETFDVLSVSGQQQVFSCPDTFDIRHTTVFLWDDQNDWPWVYSGDIGTFYWKEEAGQWVRYTYRQGEAAPQYLKELRPQFFK